MRRAICTIAATVMASGALVGAGSAVGATDASKPCSYFTATQMSKIVGVKMTSAQHNGASPMNVASCLYAGASLPPRLVTVQVFSSAALAKIGQTPAVYFKYAKQGFTGVKTVAHLGVAAFTYGSLGTSYMVETKSSVLETLVTIGSTSAAKQAALKIATSVVSKLQ